MKTFSFLKPSLIPAITLLVVVFYLLFLNGAWQKCISWDVAGYYFYLPSSFIFNDLTYTKYDMYLNMLREMELSSTFYQVFQTETGNFINKYSMGMAIFYTPFFFIADWIAQIFDYPRNGFSEPYHASLLIGGYLYLLLGVLMLVKILSKFYSNKIVLIVTTLLFFGTNFLNYAYRGTIMPHIILFAVYTLLVWFTIKWHEQQRIRYIMALAAVYALLCLSRPSEIISFFIPLLWGVGTGFTFKEKIKFLLSQKMQLGIFALIVFMFAFPQMLYWRILGGKWIITDYGNPAEGFDFLTPHFVDALFGFRIGYFIYTPITFFAVLGFYFLWKKKQEFSWAYIIFYLFNLYVICSWSAWWYAGGFSGRAFIQSSVILCFPLAELVQVMLTDKKWTFVFYTLFGFLLILNLFQTWQYNEGIITHDFMTKEYYFRIFGKTSATPEDREYLMFQRDFSGDAEKLPDSKKIIKTNEIFLNFEDMEGTDTNYIDAAFNGKSGDYINKDRIFSTNFRKKYSAITDKDHAWIEIELKVKPTQDPKLKPFSLVNTFMYKGHNNKYFGFDSEKMNLKVNEWNDVKYVYLTPEIRDKDEEEFVFYLYNRSDQTVYYDQMVVRFYESKPKE